MRCFKFLNMTWGFLLSLIMAMGLVTSAVYAVDGDPPGLFELDGNPQQDDASPPPDDWETLFDECGFAPVSAASLAAGCGSASVFTGIIADPAPESIFTGGGSKDIKDVSVPGVTANAWLHQDGSVPDKDDITNAYAAGYVVPEDVCLNAGGDPVLCSDGTAVPGSEVHHQDDFIIYFGADRFANNGDAFIGFWFFQEEITLTDSSLKGGFEFDGNHKNGDILILANFPQGSGESPIIQVLEWQFGAGDVADNLLELIPPTAAACDGMGNKEACAITNDEVDGSGPDIGDVPSVWAYTPKGGVLGDDHPFETFFSGGINITKVLEGANICFSSFMAETRSSSSETAQLKDFVLGAFPQCSANAVTEIHAGSNTDTPPHTEIPLDSSVAVVGDTIHDSVTVTGTALGSPNPPDPSSPPDVTFVLFSNGTCTPAVDADGDGFPDNPATDSGVLDISTGTLAGGTPDDGISTAESGNFVLTATGAHSYRAFWGGDANYPNGAVSGCEPFNVIQPKLTIRKEILSCADDGGMFAVSVDGTSISATLGDPTVASLIDGDTEGPNGLDPGSYTVRETAQDAYVAVYDGALTDCNSTASGSVQTITLADNDDKTCTFLNVRKPQVTVIKQIDGTAGTFDLRVNGVKVNTVQPLQGSTLIHTLVGNNFGTPTVSEVATGGTSLADYSTIIQCDDGTSDAWDRTASTSERSVTLGTLQPGDHVTCTITNVSPDLGKACLSTTP